jgi:hypothetical protein
MLVSLKTELLPTGLPLKEELRKKPLIHKVPKAGLPSKLTPTHLKQMLF